MEPMADYGCAIVRGFWGDSEGGADKGKSVLRNALVRFQQGMEAGMVAEGSFEGRLPVPAQSARK